MVLVVVTHLSILLKIKILMLVQGNFTLASKKRTIPLYHTHTSVGYYITAGAHIKTHTLSLLYTYLVIVGILRLVINLRFISIFEKRKLEAHLC